MTKRFTLTTKVMTKKDGASGNDTNDWCWKEITDSKTVTDKMEERNGWKSWYAKQWFMKKYNLTARYNITVTER